MSFCHSRESGNLKTFASITRSLPSTRDGDDKENSLKISKLPSKNIHSNKKTGFRKNTTSPHF